MKALGRWSPPPPLRIASFPDRERVPTVKPSQAPRVVRFLLFSRARSPLHLGHTLAYPNCWHCFSCALGPWLSKNQGQPNASAAPPREAPGETAWPPRACRTARSVRSAQTPARVSARDAGRHAASHSGVASVWGFQFAVSRLRLAVGHRKDRKQNRRDDAAPVRCRWVQPPASSLFLLRAGGG